jgi:hypothetical protein
VIVLRILALAVLAWMFVAILVLSTVALFAKM